MIVIETVMRDIQGLSLRQQVEVARYVQRLTESARRKRAAGSACLQLEDKSLIIRNSLSESSRFGARATAAAVWADQGSGRRGTLRRLAATAFSF
jgi:hypothetical protein